VQAAAQSPIQEPAAHDKECRDELVLVFTPPEWPAFPSDVQDGEFDNA
jgi:hypothetical protein